MAQAVLEQPVLTQEVSQPASAGNGFKSCACMPIWFALVLCFVQRGQSHTCSVSVCWLDAGCGFRTQSPEVSRQAAGVPEEPRLATSAAPICLCMCGEGSCVLAARNCDCMRLFFAAACERGFADTLQSVQWFGNRAPVKVTRHKSRQIPNLNR